MRVGAYSMSRLMKRVAIVLMLSCGSPAWAVVEGSLKVQWIDGAEACSKDARPRLQVHAYEAQFVRAWRAVPSPRTPS